MMRTKKQLIVCLLTFSLLLGTFSGSSATAVKKVSLSSKKITITEGTSKTLKVKNTKKKVKWGILYGKNCITLEKKGKVAKVKGKKEGVAKIQAIVEKKKMACKVVVKSAKKDTNPTIVTTAVTNPPEVAVDSMPVNSSPSTGAPLFASLPPENSTLPPKNTMLPEESLLPPENTRVPEENPLPPENTRVPEENPLPPENTRVPEENPLPPENTRVPEEQSETQLSYQVYIQETGWMTEVAEGETAGTTGKSRRLEGLVINLNNSSVQGDVKYRAHVAEQGWQDWKTSGNMSGTTGKSQAIEAVEIYLTGELSEKYDIYYRLHVEEIGWLGWAKNGELAGSTALRIESQAIQIKLVPKGETFDTVKDAVVKRPTLTYQAYCQDQGWKEVVKENSMAGTTGKSLRLEALKLNLSDTNIKGTIQYRAHVSKDGWQAWKSSGELAGTTGQSKAIEAVQIQLTSEMGAIFDIYYRVYSAEIGWLGWAKNGAYAGTTGGGLRAEAVQVVMINKGGAFSTGAAAYRQYTSSENGDSRFVIRTTAPTTDNAYYYSKANSFYPSYAPYPGTLDAKGNCTWYAFGRAYEILKSRPNLSINSAGAWYNYNKNNGCYAYGATPRQGAIVCWSNHVAVVEKVNTDGTILISESSYKGYYPEGFLFRTRTVSATKPDNGGDTFYGYIYIK